MRNLEILISEDDKALILGRRDRGSWPSGSAYDILEVLDSNLDRHTECPYVFLSYSQSLQANVGVLP